MGPYAHCLYFISSNPILNISISNIIDLYICKCVFQAVKVRYILDNVGQVYLESEGPVHFR